MKTRKPTKTTRANPTPRMTRGAVILFLKHALETEIASVRRLHVGLAYEPGLRAALDVLESEAGHVTPDDAENARAALAALMAEQDELDAAIWNELEGVRLNRRLPEAVRVAVQRIRTEVYADVPPPARRAPGVRGQRADELGRVLPGLEPELGRVTTRIPGETIGDWLRRWRDLSAQIVPLYSKPDATPKREARVSGVLLNRTVGLVGRMRAAVRDELAAHPELPATIEGELFGLWDKLTSEAQAEARRRARTKRKPDASSEAPPAEAAPVAEVADTAEPLAA